MSTPTSPAAPVPQTSNIDRENVDKFHQLPPLPSWVLDEQRKHPTFQHCTPPEAPQYHASNYKLFLAGSIEMGKAIAWQRHMLPFLHHLPLDVCNPRRGNWDPNSKPTAEDKNFSTQVKWELSALEKADVICFFFDVDTKSPVTMLELGLWASSKKVVVCCGDGFWKGGNIHMVCDRYNIPCVKDFSELVVEVKKMLQTKGLDIISSVEIQRDADWARCIVDGKRSEAVL